MKKLILIFSALILFSCSKDTDTVTFKLYGVGEWEVLSLVEGGVPFEDSFSGFQGSRYNHSYRVRRNDLVYFSAKNTSEIESAITRIVYYINGVPVDTLEKKGSMETLELNKLFRKVN